MEEIKPLKNNIEIFEITGEILEVTGHVAYDTNYSLHYRINDGEYTAIDTYERPELCYDEENKFIVKGYTLKLDIADVRQLEFYLERDGEYRLLTNNTYKYSRLSNIKYHYYFENGFLIKHADKRTRFTIIKGIKKPKRMAHELRYLKHLCFKKRCFGIAAVRTLAFAYRLINRRPVWLFSDREFMGQDSGETLFKYALKQPETKDKTLIFVVDKNYPDYKRIAEYGRVCSYHSLKFKLLIMSAEYVISSHADVYVTNPFGKDRKFVADLLGFRYIYLTHGILLHDSSGWLNRINKHFALNVVTCPSEYDSIINGAYYFEPEQLIKTGMPRYDNYFNNRKEESKVILFMPSWREAIAGEKIPGTQRRQYNEDFVNSEYYGFYRSLLGNERLLQFLRDNEHVIRFCIHPSFRSQLKDFELLANDVVQFRTDIDSQEETLTGRLLVTDYSSAACDFAFLNKPVVYANYDLDHIDSIHYYEKGYFDYDKDGFGPDCRTEDEVIDCIIKYITNGYVVEDEYKKRADKFFYHRDNKNSERVLKEILMLSKKTERA